MNAVRAWIAGSVLLVVISSVMADSPAVDTVEKVAPAATAKADANEKKDLPQPGPNAPPRPAEIIEPQTKDEVAPVKPTTVEAVMPKPLTPAVEPPRASSSVLSDDIEPAAPMNIAQPSANQPEQVAAPKAERSAPSAVTAPAAPKPDPATLNMKTPGKSATPAPTKTSAPATAGGRPDMWRYKWYQGRWWYYLPNNQWIYFDGTAWQDLIGGNGAPVTTNSPVTRGEQVVSSNPTVATDPSVSSAPLASTPAPTQGYGYSIGPTYPSASVYVGPFGFRASYIPSPATYGWYPGGAYLGGYGFGVPFVGPNYGIMPGAYGPGWYGR
jgi:hypothetical protein